jgi:hypothetical protein
MSIEYTETVIIAWPEIQDYMDYEGFDANATLINSGDLYKQYGDSAYIVNAKWANDVDSNRINKLL